MSPLAHAKLGASSAHRWAVCGYSVKAENGLPDSSSAFAAEGTAAHALAEHCLETGSDPLDLVGQEFEGIEVDAEMAEYIAGYVAYVKGISGEHLYEVRVDYSNIVPEGFGTCDALIIQDGHWHVVDLKYGKGKAVDAFENYQGILYALGAINDFGHIYECKRVTIHIYQPRIANFSTWEIDIKELLVWADFFKERAQVALSDDAVAVPGPKQCQWCKAKATCKPLADFMDNLIKDEFDDLEKPEELSVERAVEVHAHRELIKGWIDAIEARLMSIIEQGGSVPGWKLVEGRSMRKWIDEEKVASRLMEDVTEEKIYKRKLIGIGEAEKLIGKKRFNSEFSDLTIKPAGKPTLVPESDKRKPIGNVADMFDKEG